MTKADLTGFDWIGAAVVAVALGLTLSQVAPPGVAIAILSLVILLWQGWRKRRSDRPAARAWLIDHAVAVAGCWAIAWTLVLVLPTPLALVIAFSAMFAWMAWRKRRAALVA